MNITLNILPMREYFGAEARRADLLVPSDPTLYLWTVDLYRFGRSWLVGGTPELVSKLHLVQIRVEGDALTSRGLQ